MDKDNDNIENIQNNLKIFFVLLNKNIFKYIYLSNSFFNFVK